MENYFSGFDWQTMMSLNPWPANPKDYYSIEKYHKILSPDRPAFLEKYIQLPLLQRLKGVGLLCGTDWTRLYKNRIYYSRLDHSIGVALIIWNFTKDKKQTLAGLFHDVSTPVFSHVSDFRKGDALTQTLTEEDNAGILKNDPELACLLQEDGLKIEEISDYHIYPVADNEIPRLSADRLEYMFPSGMALDGSWDLASIKKVYEDITVLTNEEGRSELGFNSPELALEYCRRFCMIGHILQLNENKLTLQLLGQIMNLAVQEGLLCEEDFMNKSEKEIMDRLDTLNREGSLDCQATSSASALARLYKTFRSMTKIEHTDKPLADHFCISLNVKQRYIDPLVGTASKARRLSSLSPQARRIIDDFLSYKDSLYGCVKLV